MRILLFGYSPSPAVPNNGLRRSTQEDKTDFGTEVRLFVERDFYVDDGLQSLTTVGRCQSIQVNPGDASSNLRLYKKALNNKSHEDVLSCQANE